MNFGKEEINYVEFPYGVDCYECDCSSQVIRYYLPAYCDEEYIKKWKFDCEEDFERVAYIVLIICPNCGHSRR